MFSCKSAAYFRNTFSQEHLRVAASEEYIVFTNTNDIDRGRLQLNILWNIDTKSPKSNLLSRPVKKIE